LAKEKRAVFEWKKANPISALGMIAQHAGLMRLSVVNLIYNVVHYIFPTVFALYTSHRYGWTPQKLGFTLALVGMFTVVVQGFMVQPVVKAIGERRALWVACTGGALGFVLAGWSATEIGFWLSLPLLALMGLFGPSVTALMSHKVPADAQGRLQGFNVSITGVAGLVGPAIFSATFGQALASTSQNAVLGAPFYLAAALMVWAMVLTFRAR